MPHFSSLLKKTTASLAICCGSSLANFPIAFAQGLPENDRSRIDSADRPKTRNPFGRAGVLTGQTPRILSPGLSTHKNGEVERFLRSDGKTLNGYDCRIAPNSRLQTYPIQIPASAVVPVTIRGTVGHPGLQQRTTVGKTHQTKVMSYGKNGYIPGTSSGVGFTSSDRKDSGTRGIVDPRR
jgi:hypothetical protein